MAEPESYINTNFCLPENDMATISALLKRTSLNKGDHSLRAGRMDDS